MSKSTPAPPDWRGVAEETAAGDKALLDEQTAANRPDQFNPFGSTQWTQDEAGKWTQTQSLNPESQRALDAELKLGADRSELAGGMIDRLGDTYKDPMDFSGLPAYGDIPQAGNLQAGNLQAGSIEAGNLQTQAGVDPNQLTPEQLQRGVDFSGAEQRTSADELRQSSEDAIYGRSTSRLDPQWEQRSDQMQAQLVAQGLRPGDPAFDQAMENMGRERTDAYQQAQFGAIMGGGQEAQRQQGMQLAGREQDMGQALREGNFANTATGQQFGMNQQAGGQNFAQALASQGQAFGQEAQAGQQNFGQQAQAGQQNFGQQAQAGQQNFGQQAQAGQQNFNQQTSQSQQQTQRRQDELRERLTERGLPLNEINAIISGQQVNMPGFENFSSAGRGTGADYTGAAQSQYGSDMDAYNAQQSWMNSMMSGLGMMGQAGINYSDRRLKRHIKRIGSFKQYPWYLFQYIWGQWSVGVMADEVNEDAVLIMPNGYAAVDYRRIA